MARLWLLHTGLHLHGSTPSAPSPARRRSRPPLPAPSAAAPSLTPGASALPPRLHARRPAPHPRLASPPWLRRSECPTVPIQRRAPAPAASVFDSPSSVRRHLGIFFNLHSTTERCSHCSAQRLSPQPLARSDNAELTREAADVFIWCLTQNVESYKQWEKLHPENIEASVAVLSKIAVDWKEVSPKISSEALKATVKNLKAKNEVALEAATDSGKQASIKEADKYCKLILGRLTRGATCLKGSLLVITLAVAAGFVLSPNLEIPSDWDKLQVMVSSHLSF